MNRISNTIATTVDGFLPGERLTLATQQSGTLNGLRFAVKDNIDIAGSVTGAGSPYWAETHAPALKHAPVVDRLLAAGAEMVGKTVTEEMAYSVIGDNVHFGRPINPATKHCFAGGSSSGSASVVAAGLADFALGTDTAGSIRVPASNCGLYGLRPSHDAIEMTGVVPLASSFDVIGVLAASPEILQNSLGVLLPSAHADSLSGCYLYQPAFELLPGDYRAAYARLLKGWAMPVLGSVDEAGMWPEQSDQLSEALRILQSSEAWAEHGEWVSGVPDGAMAADVRARFIVGRDVNEDMLSHAASLRKALREEMDALLQKYGAIVIPTVSEHALPLRASADAKLSYRKKIMRLTCLSSLAGLPELTLPLVTMGRYRLGISIIAGRGCDPALLGLALGNNAS